MCLLFKCIIYLEPEASINSSVRKKKKNLRLALQCISLKLYIPCIIYLLISKSSLELNNRIYNIVVFTIHNIYSEATYTLYNLFFHFNKYFSALYNIIVGIVDKKPGSMPSQESQSIQVQSMI